MYLIKELRYYCNVNIPKCRRMPPQVIPYYDLTLVLKGCHTYIIDGKAYEVRKNDAILIRPGSTRERLASNDPVKFISYNFYTPEDLPLDVYLHNVITADIHRLISVFPQGHITAFNHDKEKVASILNYILYELLDLSVYKSKNDHIVQILRYIDTNLSAPISLEGISKHVNLTKEYTSSLFKKEMGQTVVEYINRRKTAAAKNMIDSTDLSLEEIASSFGFENYSYFSKVFKKHFGISPIKFRNR